MNYYKPANLGYKDRFSTILIFSYSICKFFVFLSLNFSLFPEILFLKKIKIIENNFYR
jgi:hypothetical protein